MTLADARPFLIRQFLVLFIVTMVRVNEIGKLPDLGPEVVKVYLYFVEMGTCVYVFDYISANGTDIWSTKESNNSRITSPFNL